MKNNILINIFFSILIVLLTVQLFGLLRLKVANKDNRNNLSVEMMRILMNNLADSQSKYFSLFI